MATTEMKTDTSTIDLETINIDCYGIILTYLPYRDIISCRLLNKQFCENTISCGDNIWKQICCRDFMARINDYFPELNSGTKDWYSHYKILAYCILFNEKYKNPTEGWKLFYNLVAVCHGYDAAKPLYIGDKPWKSYNHYVELQFINYPHEFTGVTFGVSRCKRVSIMNPIVHTTYQGIDGWSLCCNDANIYDQAEYGWNITPIVPKQYALDDQQKRIRFVPNANDIIGMGVDFVAGYKLAKYLNTLKQDKVFMEYYNKKLEYETKKSRERFAKKIPFAEWKLPEPNIIEYGNSKYEIDGIYFKYLLGFINKLDWREDDKFAYGLLYFIKDRKYFIGAHIIGLTKDRSLSENGIWPFIAGRFAKEIVKLVPYKTIPENILHGGDMNRLIKLVIDSDEKIPFDDDNK